MRNPNAVAPIGLSLRSAKIAERHLDKLAIVYIRQSTPQQVLEHRESRARQYALADQAAALGWRPDRLRFDAVVDGRATRVRYDLAPLYRAFTP